MPEVFSKNMCEDSSTKTLEAKINQITKNFPPCLISSRSFSKKNDDQDDKRD